MYYEFLIHEGFTFVKLSHIQQNWFLKCVMQKQTLKLENYFVPSEQFSFNVWVQCPVLIIHPWSWLVSLLHRCAGCSWFRVFSADVLYPHSTLLLIPYIYLIITQFEGCNLKGNKHICPLMFKTEVKYQSVLARFICLCLTLTRVCMTLLFLDLESPKWCRLKAQILKSDAPSTSHTPTRTESRRREEDFMAQSCKRQ